MTYRLIVISIFLVLTAANGLARKQSEDKNYLDATVVDVDRRASGAANIGASRFGGGSEPTNTYTVESSEGRYSVREFPIPSKLFKPLELSEGSTVQYR